MKYKYITCCNELDNYGGNGRKDNKAKNDHSMRSQRSQKGTK